MYDLNKIYGSNINISTYSGVEGAFFGVKDNKDRPVWMSKILSVCFDMNIKTNEGFKEVWGPCFDKCTDQFSFLNAMNFKAIFEDNTSVTINLEKEKYEIETVHILIQERISKVISGVDKFLKSKKGSKMKKITLRKQGSTEEVQATFENIEEILDSSFSGDFDVEHNGAKIGIWNNSWESETKNDAIQDIQNEIKG